LDAGESGAVTATFTIANDVPADGKFEITFPTGFDVSGATITSISGQGGTAGTGHTIAIDNQKVTVTRGTIGTPSAFTAGGVTTVELGSVTNPDESGPTDTYTITTQNNAGTIIDTLASVSLLLQ